jgi:hypothetical protein
MSTGEIQLNNICRRQTVSETMCEIFVVSSIQSEKCSNALIDIARPSSISSFLHCNGLSDLHDMPYLKLLGRQPFKIDGNSLDNGTI